MAGNKVPKRQTPAPKRKSKARKKGKPTPRRSSQQSVVISECSRDYLRALTDTFAVTSLPCVPDFPPLPSEKLESWVRATGIIGSAGVGFILVNPYIMYDTTLNTASISSGAGTGYAGTTFELSGPNGITQLKPHSNYAFNAAVARSVRTVGCGLRVRYSGTQLNASGNAYGVVQPAHTSLVGIDVNSARNYQGTTGTSFANRGWHSLYFSPIYPDELEYVPTTVVGPNAPNTPMMGFLLVGESGSKFEVEIRAFHEMIGVQLANATMSHSDPVGFSATLETVAKKTARRETKLDWNKALAWTGEAIGRTASYAVTLGEGVMKGAVKAAPKMIEGASMAAPLLLM